MSIQIISFYFQTFKSWSLQLFRQKRLISFGLKKTFTLQKLNYLFILGGWLRIGRVYLTSTNIAGYTLQSVLSSDFTKLYMAQTQNYLLSGSKYAALRTSISFNEFRVYCYKPIHGRTNHLKFSSLTTNGVPWFNYAMGTGNAPASSCDALTYFSNDNSVTKGQACTKVKPGSRATDRRLYAMITFVNGLTHFSVEESRPECDDYTVKSPYNKYGTWLFYVRWETKNSNLLGWPIVAVSAMDKSTSRKSVLASLWKH